MRSLMFGWEFPPYISGGLGTACYGITRAMSKLGTEIIFVIPKIRGEIQQSHVNLVSASDVPVDEEIQKDIFLKRLEFRIIHSIMHPYMNEKEYRKLLQGIKPGEKSVSFFDFSGSYGPNLIDEVIRYGEVAEALARQETFDLIHSHDWLTAFAGTRAKRVSGKPYIYHAHALEFDRSGEDINQDVYNIERYGMELADRIIAVSHFTKSVITSRYGIPEDKVIVVHNAVSRKEGETAFKISKQENPVVLFLGRITFQKGPDYFVEAAGRVLEAVPETTFVMAGSGDMMPRMVERVAELGIGKNFHFTGFLRGPEVERIYAISDLYVMPSVSEPFGISPLEAMLYDVPVIISKQSGVAEILHHALKVDFWNIEELANKIIAVLKYPVLMNELRRESQEELRTIRWRNAAEKILEIYRDLLS